MHKKTFVLAFAVGLLAAGLAVAEPVGYKVDADHSSIGFSIRHFVSDVDGRFKDFDGMVRYDKQNPAASSVQLNVRAASINTDNNDRDNHLRSPDFFDVQKFPAWTFTSTSVAVKDANTLNVTGDLTIHGVTKRVTLPVSVLGSVKVPKGEKAGFKTSFTVDRKDYGVVWNRALEGGGAMLGDEVTISIKIEANREAAAATAK
ncbi:MAG: YceI family protein [Acidobacteriota bacterium]|nr:YceI family protein [Acidobacteriota bacterium]